MKQRLLINRVDEWGAALQLIKEALFAAEEKFPGWPEDVVHGAAILNEEAGEATKAALDFYYGRDGLDKLKYEVAQTGAMALRMLFALGRMKEDSAQAGLNGSKVRGEGDG